LGAAASEERTLKAAEIVPLRDRHKGVSSAMARDTMLDVSYFGTMMVHWG
jgi:phosphotransacetylase